MTVELSAEDKAVVESLLQRGIYASAAEAVHYGLEHLWEEVENAARIRAALQEAVESTGRGEIVRGDDFLNELAARRLRQA